MKRRRFLYLISLYLLAVLAGVRATALPQRSYLSDLLLQLEAAIVITQLCVVDARLLGRPLVHAAQWVMFLSWPLAVPIYVLWSRKLRGALLLLAHVILLYVAYYAGAIAMWLAYPWLFR